MKGVSVAFLAILLLAHRTGDAVKRLTLPLSMFRDDGQAILGYALFALLLLAGSLMIAALLRTRLHAHVCLFSLTALLLLLVAVTPSTTGVHNACSLVVLAVLYTYYAVLLRGAGSRWFWLHLTMPILLVLATHLHSYGLSQKCLILYFLLAVNVHHHVLRQWLQYKPEADRLYPEAWRPRRRVVS